MTGEEHAMTVGRVEGYPYYSGPASLHSYHATIDRLREGGPFYWNGNDDNGYWVLTDPQAVMEAYKTPDLFLSDSVIATDPNPPFKWIPIMLDGDEHRTWRRLMAPAFTPRRIKEIEDGVRVHAVRIIEALAPRGKADALMDFGNIFPTIVFMELMGLPVEDADRFLAWEHAMLNTPAGEDPDRSISVNAQREVTEYLELVIAAKRADPGEDLISMALSWQIDGAPISHDDLMNYCLLMVIGGLDTVQSTLSWAFYHLATHPDDRARIIEDDSLVPAFVEEILRVYAIIQVARKASRDDDFHGCPVKKGDMVLLPISVAARDPRTYPDPTTVRFDRGTAPQFAFGAGPHRCPGLDLARRELRIAIEEWHRWIPHYALDESFRAIEEVGAQIRVPAVPLRWQV
jgi:cytochrome P450